MDKSKFYFSDGTPFFGIFQEIPMSGVWIKGEEKTPVYTISEDDGDLPSAHRVYMDALNEYDAATRLVPSWTYWKTMLKNSVKIRRVIEEWREEKMLRDQMRAKSLLWAQAEKGNISAQRVLYESKKEEKQQAESRRQQTAAEQREQSIAEERLARLTQLKAIK